MGVKVVSAPCWTRQVARCSTWVCLMSSLLPSWHRVSMAALIMVRDKEKVFSQDSSSAGGEGRGRQSQPAPSCGRTSRLSATLTHDASPGVFVQVRCAVSHHRQDVAAGGDVDFLPTEGKKNQSKSTGEG